MTSPMTIDDAAAPIFADSMPMVKVHGPVAHLLFGITQSPVLAAEENCLCVHTRLIIPTELLEDIALKILAVIRTRDSLPRPTTAQNSNLTN